MVPCLGAVTEGRGDEGSTDVVECRFSCGGPSQGAEPGSVHLNPQPRETREVQYAAPCSGFGTIRYRDGHSIRLLNQQLRMQDRAEDELLGGRPVGTRVSRCGSIGRRSVGRELIGSRPAGRRLLQYRSVGGEPHCGATDESRVEQGKFVGRRPIGGGSDSRRHAGGKPLRRQSIRCTARSGGADLQRPEQRHVDRRANLRCWFHR